MAYVYHMKAKVYTQNPPHFLYVILIVIVSERLELTEDQRTRYQRPKDRTEDSDVLHLVFVLSSNLWLCHCES